MRIYNRTEFMKLPSGTLYAKGKSWYFDGMSVKGETIVIDGRAIDFGRRGLQWIDSFDTGEAAERLTAMLEDGASFPIETDYGRDGHFDDEDIFLVYEIADLQDLRAVIDEAIAITTRSPRA